MSTSGTLSALLILTLSLSANIATDPTTAPPATGATTANNTSTANSTTAAPPATGTTHNGSTANNTTAAPPATGATTANNTSTANSTTATPPPTGVTTANNTSTANSTTAAPPATGATTANNTSTANSTTAAPPATGATTANNTSTANSTTAAPPATGTTASNTNSSTASTITSTANTATSNATGPTTAKNTSVVTPPSTSVVQTTSQPITNIYVRLHITNKVYSIQLNDPTSSVFLDLEAKIKNLFNDVYNCSACSTRNSYIGVLILSFSPGSINADTQTQFKGTESSSTAQTLLTEALSKNSNQLNGLQIDSVQVSTSPSIVSSSASPVPGWGIALLVLASVLVFLCIIFIIAMIVLLCRRKHSGHMDMFTTRGSYHSMNDYTSYQTHGRYVAPNKYEAAGNGTKNQFSYSNQGLETDNL